MFDTNEIEIKDCRINLPKVNPKQLHIYFKFIEPPF